MRRAAVVIVGTLGALGLLLSFHSSPATPKGIAAHATTATRPPASAPPPPPSTDTAGGAGPTTTTGGGRHDVKGPVVSTRYGDVQVSVTVSGSRLVDVTALELPSDRARSARISEFAGPELHDEALQAQSANIDVVSGATYTSEGYAQSLQAALDAAGIRS